MKKLSAALLLMLTAASLTACGSAAKEEAKDVVSITVFNSKMEVQDQFVEAAKKYSADKGVNVEVYYNSDTVASHIANKYASNDPYTIAMVDPKDIYLLADEFALDLSGEKWVDQTEYEIVVNDRVVGFPLCIEARGIMYNADAIEKITGETFDPANYATLDAFEGLLEELVAGGMTTPTAIMKEDWSLAAHYLAEIYEQQADPEAFIQGLTSGTQPFGQNEKFNSMMDTFDVLMKYNYAANSPVAAEREVSEQKLAEGEVAFMFGGNWDWSMINAFDYSENMGMMPVPQNTTDGTNEKLVGSSSKYCYIDASDNTSDAERQAAKDFLNWMVNDAEGNKFLTEDCAFVPAYTNINAPSLDPLSKSVKAYADAGKLISTYNYLPDDHITVAGGIMQKYLAGQVDRAGFEKELETYWSTAKVIEH